MHNVTLEEAQTHLPELIVETQLGEEIVITKNGQPVARLAAAGGWPLFGLLKGKMTIAPDFNEPLEGFRPYME